MHRNENLNKKTKRNKKQEQTNDDIKQVAVETPPSGRAEMGGVAGEGGQGEGGVSLREETWKLLVCLSFRRDGAESASLSCFCLFLSLSLSVCLSVGNVSLSLC